MEVELPDDFRCPISLEVMTDPVVLSSGHTFERASIQRWLDSGNCTCPVTNLPLPPSVPLIPNHALRSLISSFAPRNPGDSHPRPPPAAAPADVDPRALVAAFSFPSDAATLAAVLRLVKRSPAFRRLVADCGASSVLLRHASVADRPDFQDLALRVILHLSLDGDDARVSLVAEGAIDSVVAALRGPAAALAATVLTSLAVVEVNKCTIGAHPAAVPGLARLLQDGAAARERREAATALYELCKLPVNRRRAVWAGAVPSLLQFAKDGSERAIEVLGLLAKCREGKEEMKKANSFARVLLDVLRVGRARGVQHALLALSLICSDSRDVALEAIKEGALDLCFLFVGDENEKIAKNAMGLAQTLEKQQFDDLI